MFEIILAYMFAIGLVIFVIQFLVSDIQDKWCCLSNYSKVYFLCISDAKFLLNKELLSVDKEVFDAVMKKQDSLTTKILFIIYLLSLIGTLHILIKIIKDYSIAKIEIINHGNKCT